VAVVGSTGFVEVAVNGGSAASQLGVSVGDPVRIRLQRKPAAGEDA
jgi:S-adenosylmethionine hydrolase